MAICAGAIIGIGGAASLLANALLGVEGKIIGATLFSLGIYAIVVFEMRLFTGMIADIPTLGVIFPVIVFAFCGFDHSVANMMYFYYLGEISWEVVGYVLLCILGNIIGGVAFPCITLVKEYAIKDKKEEV